MTKGKPAVVVAVVDDGVDIDHPNLKRRIWRNPNPRDPDQHGRDFFIPDDNPDHFDPRPKRFEFPFDDTPTRTTSTARVAQAWSRPRAAMRGGSRRGA